MKTIYSEYEHTLVGFPKVVLKFSFSDWKYKDPYVVVNGIIREWDWRESGGIGNYSLNKELERFDQWVAATFSECAEVQG